MGVIVAVTGALCAWIVLWSVGFGRTGDAFIITVPIITLVAVAMRGVIRGFSANKE